MEEKSAYDLLHIFSLKCSVKEPSFCLQCESCILIDKINCTKSWFTSLGYQNQKQFLEELITSSPELLNKLPTILYGLQSKDYQYAKSRLKPSVKNDAYQSNTNHSLDINKIHDLIVDYLTWFKSSSDWSRSNYVLVLLQLCGTPLLDTIKEFVLNNAEKPFVSNISVIPEIKENDGFDSLRSVNRISREHIPKCKSAPPICRINDIDTRRLRKNIKSARERVLFDDKVSIIDTVTEVELPEPSEYRTNSREYRTNSSEYGTNSSEYRTNSRLPSRSSIRSGSSRYQFCVQSNSSARCTPLIFDNSPSTMNLCDDMSACNELNSSQNITNAKDFIKCLPVHLAKKILSYLDERNLRVASCVSILWKELSKQVKSDEKYVQARKEDVMMMQSTGVKTPHPCYARLVPVFVPKLDAHERVQVNKEGRHIDVEIIIDEFADINMEHCYDGLETEKVVMEERNVYCSSYNVLMMESRHDPNRHIHYDGGELVIVGSSDRKIHVVNAKTGDRVRRIYGHSGSVRCLYLNERNNIVVSGSYDTTARLWNLKTGKCNIIFLGHQGTVVSVDVSKAFLVSSATDCIMKIWNLSTGKCHMNVTHSSVIRVLQILGDQIITGTSNGEVLTWSLKTGQVVKTFKGHEDAVNCLKANPYFIFTGSSDGLVKLWNNVGNLYTCLKSFRHPGEVLCLEVCFCRLMTGCYDGKIRVWNTLNANCLRVIRGNSRNDPISNLFASENRLVVNTVSSILVYNFEGIQWNYSAPREQGEVSNKKHTPYTFDDSHPYSYTRAQKMIYHGSPLHKIKRSNNAADEVADAKHITEINNAKNRSNRVKSAPVSRPPCNNRIQSAPVSRPLCNNRIQSAPVSRPLCNNRIQSAPVSRLPSNDTHKVFNSGVDRLMSAPGLDRGLCSVDQHISRIKSANRAPTLLKGEKDHILAKFEPSDKRLKSATVRTRCRSAPVQRVMDVSQNERGVSTSSVTITENNNNRKLILRAPAVRKYHRPKTAISSNTDTLNNLKLRTFYSQLDFEEELQNI